MGNFTGGGIFKKWERDFTDGEIFTVLEIFTDGGIFHRWGGFHHLATFCQFLPILEILVVKRIAPLNSSIEDGSKSLNMLGSIRALPWSCKKSGNSAWSARTLKDVPPGYSRHMPDIMRQQPGITRRIVVI